MLFTDGSVDTKTGIGFGAYLMVNELGLPLSDLTSAVKTKKFENTSSTTLELQTLLWALADTHLLMAPNKLPVTIYTDSQNIVGLSARRSGLEQRNYYASNGKRLTNADLYQQFFNRIDQCNCQIIKVAGHNPQHEKNAVDCHFTLVDKASRSALREFNRQVR